MFMELSSNFLSRAQSRANDCKKSFYLYSQQNGAEVRWVTRPSVCVYGSSSMFAHNSTGFDTTAYRDVWGTCVMF